MKLFKTRKRAAIEHWHQMAAHYEQMADSKHRSGETVRLAVHYRAMAALYRFNAAELEGKH